MNASSLRIPKAAAFGLFLGFALSQIGFADWGEVHRMFTFADLRLLFTFMVGLALTAAGFAILPRAKTLAPKPIHKGTIAGGALFGAGWAITGACPTVPFIQLGEGKLLAAATLLGVVAGIVVYPKIHARFFRWDRGTCES